MPLMFGYSFRSLTVRVSIELPQPHCVAHAIRKLDPLSSNLECLICRSDTAKVYMRENYNISDFEFFKNALERIHTLLSRM